MELTFRLAFRLIVGTWLLATPTWGYSNGQVAVACDTMTPQHGVQQQTGPAPYTVSVSPNQDGSMTG